jgi:coproporphyrinogen III oxidase-like Fe-S oxidoreductase
MEELSIELNPDPFEETLDFVRECHKRYEQLPRIRYSFGIQTFDDEVLKIS